MRVFSLVEDCDRFRSLECDVSRFSKHQSYLPFCEAFKECTPTSGGLSARLPPVRYTQHNIPEGDMPYLGDGSQIVFSKRAADALHDLIGPFGDFTPLSSTDGEFVAYNCVAVVGNDGFIADSIETVAFPLEHQVVVKNTLIRGPCFKQSAILGLPIFKIANCVHSYCYVGNDFVATVARSGLKGMIFKECPVID